MMGRSNQYSLGSLMAPIPVSVSDQFGSHRLTRLLDVNLFQRFFHAMIQHQTASCSPFYVSTHLSYTNKGFRRLARSPLQLIRRERSPAPRRHAPAAPRGQGGEKVRSPPVVRGTLRATSKEAQTPPVCI
jgi:hypothetical protein